MNNEKTIEVLNELVQINNDRIEGYNTASKETDEADLITLFSQLSSTSHKCKAELGNEIIKLGGTPEKGTKTSGKIFRAWMEVKAALTGKDRKAILKSCEFGEDTAVKTYEDVLENNTSDLSAEHRSIVQKQNELIKDDRDNIIHLNNSLEFSER